MVTVVAYVVFTLSVTEWRRKYRTQMNDKNNEVRMVPVLKIISEQLFYNCASF